MINAIIVMILFSYEADFFGRCKGVRTRAKCVSACMSFLEKYLLAVYLCLLSYLHRDICEVRYLYRNHDGRINLCQLFEFEHYNQLEIRAPLLSSAFLSNRLCVVLPLIHAQTHAFHQLVISWFFFVLPLCNLLLFAAFCMVYVSHFTCAGWPHSTSMRLIRRLRRNCSALDWSWGWHGGDGQCKSWDKRADLDGRVVQKRMWRHVASPRWLYYVCGGSMKRW